MSVAIRPGRGILILNHQGLGNVVLSLPLLHAVCEWSKGRWPVRVLFNTAEHAELIRGQNLNIIPLFYRPHFHGWRGAIRLLAELRGTSDLLLGVPQVPAKRVVILQKMLGARYSAAEAFPFWRTFLSFHAEKGWTKSIVATQMELASALGIPMSAKRPVLKLTQEEFAWGRATIGKLEITPADVVVGVHCSSQVPSKRWPAAFFGQVILRLKQQFPTLAVISFGNRHEQGVARIVRQHAGDIKWIEGTGAWKLRQSLVMLKHCNLVICGDTGIMHMAAGVRTPTLSIFGPTSAHRLAPNYNGSRALEPATACHPCYRDHYRACACINSIRPEEVARVAEEMLARSKVSRSDP